MKDTEGKKSSITKETKEQKKPLKPSQSNRWSETFKKKKGGKRLLVSRSIYKLISQQEQRLIFEKGCKNQNLITDREMSA